MPKNKNVGYEGPEENFGMGEIDPGREATLQRIRSAQLNYPTRSDAMIQEEVYDTLRKHLDLDTKGIEVDVQSGVVYLRGELPDRFCKRLAEECLKDIKGVEDIMNEIRVRRSGLRLS